MAELDIPGDLGDQLTPAGLEKFFIPFEEDGSVMARVGLRMSFYFRRVGAPETREALIGIAKDYVRMAGPRMRTWKLAKDRAWRKLQAGEEIDWAQVEARIPSDQGFSLAMSELEGIPEQAAFWSFSCLSSASSTREEELGYLFLHLPFTALEGAPPGTFRTLFLRWCNALAVEHAYGGMGWVVPVEVSARNAAVARLGELSLRFAALDVDDVTGVSIHCEKGIKCAAWLTAVSNRILEGLGGADAVSAAAGADVVVHPYNNGAVFQAGPAPQIGDTTKGLVPKSFVAVGRALKAVRAPYPDSMFDAPPNYVVPTGMNPHVALTQRWLSRFDGA